MTTVTEGNTEAAGTPNADVTKPAEAGAVVDTANQSVVDAQGNKAPEGVKPVEYTDFTVPEGMTLDTEVAGEFKEFMKSKNFSQEDAQKLVDMQTKIANKQWDLFQQKRAEWVEGGKTDAEFGGANYDANVATARQALDKFGTPELKQMLVTSGYGDNPEIVRLFYRIGKAIGSDKIMGSGQGTAAPKDPLKLLYPTMNQ